MQEIELAPHHKQGLLIRCPLLLSPAAIGFGEVLPPGLDWQQVGGVVVGPVSAAGQGYGGPVRLVELDGGLLASPSPFSRSARRAAELYAALWGRLGCPVIVQLVDAGPAELMRAGRRVAQIAAVAALEWQVPAGVTAVQVREGVLALLQATELPVYVKLPLENALPLAERAVQAGAAGVVVGQPLLGQVALPGPPERQPVWVTGQLSGPLASAAMLRSLAAVAAAALGCTVIACGGICHPRQIEQVLALGAHAVQLDSVLWAGGSGWRG